MGMGQFANQAMGAQQAELAANASRASVCGLIIFGLTDIEEVLEVVVTKTGDGPVSTAQCVEQSGVFAQRLQGTVTVTLAGHGSAEGGGQFAQGSACLSAGQCV